MAGRLVPHRRVRARQTPHPTGAQHAHQEGWPVAPAAAPPGGADLLADIRRRETRELAAHRRRDALGTKQGDCLRVPGFLPAEKTLSDQTRIAAWPGCLSLMIS